MTNVLYYGDNLEVLRRHVRSESVDRVYLDPPFNSNTSYNVLFAEHGERAAAQVRAFQDLAAHRDVLLADISGEVVARAFRTRDDLASSVRGTQLDVILDDLYWEYASLKR